MWQPDMHASLTWRALFAVTTARENERGKEWKGERERTVFNCFHVSCEPRTLLSSGKHSSVEEISLIMYSSYIGPPRWEMDTRTNTHSLTHKSTNAQTLHLPLCFVPCVFYVFLNKTCGLCKSRHVNQLFFFSLWKHIKGSVLKHKMMICFLPSMLAP